MASKLLNLLALSSLAVLVCSFGASPVDALATGHMVNRHSAHDGLAAKRRKRSNSKRCIQRSSSLAASSYTPSSSPSPSPNPTTSSTPPPPPPATTSYTPPPATTSSAPPPATTSASGYSGPAKVGLAWSGAPDSYLPYYKTDAVSFLYTWSIYKPSNCDSLGFEFWAQLWGEAQATDFESTVVFGYAARVVGFNEPDMSSQSNLSPSYAAQLWLQYIQPKAALGMELISPPTSSGSSGLTWMESFVSACQGCTWDACGVHWYGTEVSELQAYLQNWQTTFNCPIHLLEYADMNFVDLNVQDDLSQVFAFYSEIDPWMDSQDYILSYFAFGALTNMDGVNQNDALMSADGTPTDLGYMIFGDNYS